MHQFAVGRDVQAYRRVRVAAVWIRPGPPGWRKGFLLLAPSAPLRPSDRPASPFPENIWALVKQQLTHQVSVPFNLEPQAADSDIYTECIIILVRSRLKVQVWSFFIYLTKPVLQSAGDKIVHLNWLYVISAWLLHQFHVIIIVINHQYISKQLAISTFTIKFTENILSLINQTLSTKVHHILTPDSPPGGVSEWHVT